MSQVPLSPTTPKKITTNAPTNTPGPRGSTTAPAVPTGSSGSTGPSTGGSGPGLGQPIGSNASTTTAPNPTKIDAPKKSSKPKYKKNYIKPNKWWQVYQGDDEKKVFVSLCRDPKGFTFRSVTAIAKETKLSEKRIEEIIEKYLNRGIVFQSPKNPDMYGYWELNEKMLDEDVGSIAEEDQKDRITKAMP